MTPVFFTDRNLGKRFPEILVAAGLKVERHDDHFGPETSDEEWLGVIGSRGWVALTHDRRIRHKPNELAAVVLHNVKLLVLIGSAPFAELASNFVNTIDAISAFLATEKAPVIGKIYRATPSERARNPKPAGSVSRWYP